MTTIAVQRGTIAICLGALLIAGCGGRIDLEAEANGLVAAEKSFAARADEAGIRVAFLDALYGDGIIYRPLPVNGREWFESRKEVPGLLAWAPTFAEISSSADLGYTTGPWEYRNEEGEEPPSRGYYLSFWRKDEEGVWKLAADGGIAFDGAPALDDVGPPSIRVPAAPVTVDPEKGTRRYRQELFNAEKAFTDAARANGFGAAIVDLASDDILFYRYGEEPVRGRAAFEERIGGVDVPIMNDPLSSKSSLAGDLGYTYGTMELLHPGEEELRVVAFTFLRGWRRGSDGEWEIMVEVEVPLDS